MVRFHYNDQFPNQRKEKTLEAKPKLTYSWSWQNENKFTAASSRREIIFQFFSFLIWLNNESPPQKITNQGKRPCLVTSVLRLYSVPSTQWGNKMPSLCHVRKQKYLYKRIWNRIFGLCGLFGTKALKHCCISPSTSKYFHSSLLFSFWATFLYWWCLYNNGRD